MEFLEVLDTIRAEEASIGRLFGNEAEAGDVAVRRSAVTQTTQYKQRLGAAVALISEVATGRKPMHYLQEVMTTSDFPLFTADVLDRLVMGAYREYPKRWPQYLGSRTVRDFRTVKLFAFDGGEAYLSQIVPEMTEYPAVNLSETQYTLTVSKYGKRLPFSWELFLADDLNFLESAPVRLGNAAGRTEDRIATDLYVDANGPDATFFTAGHKNLLTGNPALSVAALQTAIVALASQVDVDNEPIIFQGMTLVVPPALAVTANMIVNATEYRFVVAGNTTIVKGNGLADNLKVVSEPYIPAIATSANGNTSWFVFGDPMNGRPAATMAFLRGYEQPQVFVKEPNQRRINGTSNPFDGDFATDAIEYKVRMVAGATLLDYRAAVASNGSGS